MPRIFRTHKLPEALYPAATQASANEACHWNMDLPEWVPIGTASSVTLRLAMEPHYNESNQLTHICLWHEGALLYQHNFAIEPTYPTAQLYLFPCGGFFAPHATLSEIEQLYAPHESQDMFPQSIWLARGYSQAVFVDGTRESLLLAIESGHIGYGGLRSYQGHKECRDSRFVQMTFVASS